MAQADAGGRPIDDLDAFLNAKDPADRKKAAETVARNANFIGEPSPSVPDRETSAPVASGEPEAGAPRRGTRVAVEKDASPSARPEDGDAAAGDDADEFSPEESLAGKFIPMDPALFEGEQANEPFVLIPAHVTAYIPAWGWAALAIGLAMLVAGVVFAPMFSLNRLAARLGDDNDAEVQYAMRRLIVDGDDRTVRKLYAMASSSGEPLRTRLRAVDALALMERLPEVDRALLRLELSDGVDDRVREAAVAARRQRDAVQAKRRLMGGGGE